MKGMLDHWFSIAVTAVAVATPQFIAAVPHDYQMLASTLFGVLGALYHLYQPSPSD